MTQSKQPLRVGVGGPVGSGKTALMEQLCKRLRDELDIAAITNDIYTKEDARILVEAGALPPRRRACNFRRATPGDNGAGGGVRRRRPRGLGLRTPARTRRGRARRLSDRRRRGRPRSAARCKPSGLILAQVAAAALAVVRLTPIGQTDGQKIQATLIPRIRALAREAANSTLADLGSCAFRADIASMRHETQNSGLFRS